MRRYFYAIPAALALTAAASNANAATIMVNCGMGGNTANLSNLFTGGMPPNPGDTVQITGICINPSNQTLKPAPPKSIPASLG